MKRASLFALLAFASLASCSPREPDRVRAGDYDSFWLWAGVRPPPELSRARSVYVLDGEIAIPVDEKLSFDDLLMRIHPAASRVQKLAREHPAIFIAFDLLVDPKGDSLVQRPLNERRATGCAKGSSCP